ncbi:MAG TPA: hypothetical protein VFR86_01125, partial [Burkholderiaceae bacterium]|nr:hypothetical protein [Burkholderiaceae bacterium]
GDNIMSANDLVYALAPAYAGGDFAAPCPASRALAVDIAALWDALEELRAMYERGTTKPVHAFTLIRAAVRAIDAQALIDRYPHVEGIVASTLLELRRWEETWPNAPGERLPPSSFGALALT